MAMRLVEGQDYVTTSAVDMRPHGEIPAGTRMRASAVFENCAALEFVNEPPRSVVEYDGAITFPSEDLYPFAPYKAPLWSRVRNCRPSYKAMCYAAILTTLFFPPLIPLDKLVGFAKAERSPMEYQHVALAKSVIPKGEQLEMIIDTKRSRACIWDWVYSWERHNEDGTKVVVAVERRHAHHVPTVGTREMYELFVDLPTGVTPGKYTLFTTGEAECNHTYYTYEDDPLKFSVE